MALDPRTPEEIRQTLQDSLSGKITKLTNFIESSFNRVWVQAFGEELHEAETRLLVAQLSGWVDYAGKSDLDQTDLDQLGVDGVEPEEINELMEDEQLDRLAPIVGVERDPGQKATGEVTVFTATQSTRVPEGMEIATQPGSDGDYNSYFVDADGDGEIGDSGSVTPSAGSTQVTVDVIAASVGDEYNVGSGSVTFLPNPPAGVEGVTNPTEITGGRGEQSNEEFREDIKNAVFESSGGGTASGIEGFVESNVENVSDVETDELVDAMPPYVDVIVEGGSDQAVQDAIHASRPAGIEHNLVRPEVVSVGVQTDLVGSDIDTVFVAEQIESYLTELDLDSEFRRPQLIQRIMNSDNDIVDLGSLSVLLLSVDGESAIYTAGTDVHTLGYEPLGVVRDERIFYDGQQRIYQLAYDQIDPATIEVVATVGNEQVTLTEGTDYELIDNTGDGDLDAIDLGIGGVNPDDRTMIRISYDHSSWSITDTITDETGASYSRGTDWQLIDDDDDGYQDSIDWSIGGSSPADGVRWFVDYEPAKTVSDNLAVTKREKIGAGGVIDVEVYDNNM